MTALGRSASIAMALGAVCMLAVAACLLALIDISHGEADLTAEWWVVRVSFAVIVLFIFTALAALRRVLEQESAAEDDDHA